MQKRIAWLISTGLMAGLLAVPGMAFANTNEAIAETGGALTLLGSGLKVDIALDDFGNIDMVDVFVAPPSEPAVPLEAEEAGEEEEYADPHRFRFADEVDGTRVDVMAKKHKLTTKVKTATFEDLRGEHTWEAVLFPEAAADEEGEEAASAASPTVVMFEIKGNEDQPIVEILGFDGFTGDRDPIVNPDDEDDEDAAVTIVFTWNGYTKTLKIKLDIDDEADEDGPTAVLKIELRAKDRQRLKGNIEQFARTHTWQGRLCEDDTVIAVDYVIDGEGVLTVTDGMITDPKENHTLKVMERGFQVRFGQNEAMLKVRFGETEDGVWDLKVDAKTTEKCKHHDDEAGERGKKDRPDKDRDHDEDDEHDEDD